MFNGINKVILVGYLGSDPEIITLSDKKSFVKISLGTSSSWKDIQTQDWIKRVEWHQLVFYSKWVSVIEKYLKKGSKIYVEGSLKTDKFEKNGNLFYSTKIICNNLLLLNNKENYQIDNEIIESTKINQQLDINKDEDDIPF